MKHQTYFSKQDACHLRTLIKEKTGYLIRSTYILSQAFRRRSYTAEVEGKSNEMFEFIGDRVLDYYAVKIVSERCVAMNIEGSYTFRIRENQFTALKQELVSNEVLSAIIDEWQIAEYMIVGKSDERNRVDLEVKVKADLFESIIGAIAVDANWDPAVLETAVRQALRLDERIQSIVESDYRPMNLSMENAVTVLKELAEKEVCRMPIYRISGPDALGYDRDGNPIWGCNCDTANDRTGIGRLVWASSKKDAKKAAAYLVLCEHFGLQNLYGDSSFYPIWIYKDGKLMPENKCPLISPMACGKESENEDVE
ncbi:MAG: ribonuclease III family protein [Clostridia bacterium]|nr:ribonuclease III family protein [Clostridia bacterium]